MYGAKDLVVGAEPRPFLDVGCVVQTYDLAGAPAGLAALIRRYEAADPAVRFRGLVLAWLQVLDGVLTAAGVHRYGVAMEGNLLLRYLMAHAGWVNALLVTKLLGILLVGFLCAASAGSGWVKQALGGVIVLYLYLAILPWAYTLA